MDIAAMRAAAERVEVEADTGPLTELGLQALALEAQINAHEEATKDLKKKLQEIMEHRIPDVMTQIGVKEFGFDTEDGSARVSTKIVVRGSLSQAPDEEAAVSLLEESGFEGGVLTEVTLKYTEDQREDAFRLSSELDGRDGKTPVVARKINPSTLRSFVRQKLEEDPDFSYSDVGCTAFFAATFTKRS